MKTNLKQSEVWNHFIIQEEGVNARCNYCNNVISTPSKSTSNLNRHLRSKHPDVDFTSTRSPAFAAKKLSRDPKRAKRQRKGKSTIHRAFIMATGGYLPRMQGYATDAIHGGQEAEQWDSWQVVPPISLSTTFKQPAPAEPIRFEYSRSGNPTRAVLEKALAKLDNANYGLCFSSGLGANTVITHLLKAGDEIVCCDDVYGGTNRYFSRCATSLGINIKFVDMTDLSQVSAAISRYTKLVWIESPTNPLMKIIDIRAIAEIVQKKPSALLVVDNTFFTSYFQRPLDLGAHLVVYSLTKYMNGHSDVVMGAITLNDEETYERLKFLQNATGIIPSPFDCYLVNRSLKTLPLRMDKHMKNGLAVAKFLENHKHIQQVFHPGLPSHPQHEITLSQCSGVSGMLSFLIEGGREEASKFLQSLRIFTLAESLGGYESLAELPVLMTHASVPEEQREFLGITDNLIRLSVGLEDEEDLIQDLEQALAVAFSDEVAVLQL